MAGCDLLLTGAGGFVGRHLAERARARGLAVHAAEGDLGDAAHVDALVARLRPAAAVHLASVRTRAGGDAWAWLAGDVALTGALLGAFARHAPGAPVLIPGSAAQYGLGADRPLREDDALAPVSAYGAIKCVLERAATTAALRGELRVIWARSFNHVGPGQGPDAPVAAWASRLAAAERAGGGVLKTGRLDVVRDFLDVRDVADAYLDLLATPAEGPVNVCSGVPVRLAELVEMLVGEARAEVRVERDPALERAVDPPLVVGDPARLRALTGWTPAVDLRASVHAVLEEWR
jgi:GDP-4-dehydro-6-deoxy-D-mannose reductase